MALRAGQAVSRFPEAARRSWRGIWRDDVGLYAAGIAFHSLAGIFAGLFLFSAFLERLGADPNFLLSIAEFFAGTVPDEAVEFIHTAAELARQPIPAAIFPLAILMTLWIASNVFQAVIHALNRIYHVEDARAAWISRLFAIAVVVMTGIFLLAALMLIALENFVTSLPDRPTGFLNLVVAANKPLSALSVVLGMLLIYWLAPKFRSGPRVVLPGAMVFAVTWLIATYGFNLYLREIAVYDRVYGPVATAVVFLTWIYLSAFLLLVGGEFNAAYRQLQVEAGGVVNPEPET